MDWSKVIRALRLFCTQIPRDRFYALYLLFAVCVAAFLMRHAGS
jgi:hypothetical protein